MTQKTLLLALCLIWLPFNTFAQDTNKNKGLTASIEFRYLNTFSGNIQNEDLLTYPLPYNDTYGKSLRVGIGYFINPHIMAGATMGADRYEGLAANTFPLTLQCKYYLKDARNTPYAFGEAGPQLSFSENHSGDYGFIAGAGIGYKLFASKRLCLTGTLGYNFQRSTIFDPITDYIIRHSWAFGLGFHF